MSRHQLGVSRQMISMSDGRATLRTGAGDKFGEVRTMSTTHQLAPWRRILKVRLVLDLTATGQMDFDIKRHRFGLAHFCQLPGSTSRVPSIQLSWTQLASLAGSKTDSSPLSSHDVNSHVLLLVVGYIPLQQK